MMAVAVATEGEFAFEAPVQLFARGYDVAPGGTWSSYSVARDGRFLMIEPPPGASAGAAPASIVVVENRVEELKRLVRTD